LILVSFTLILSLFLQAPAHAVVALDQVCVLQHFKEETRRGLDVLRVHSQHFAVRCAQMSLGLFYIILSLFEIDIRSLFTGDAPRS
jgi:hypothetical protein